MKLKSKLINTSTLYLHKCFQTFQSNPFFLIYNTLAHIKSLVNHFMCHAHSSHFFRNIQSKTAMQTTIQTACWLQWMHKQFYNVHIVGFFVILFKVSFRLLPLLTQLSPGKRAGHFRFYLSFKFWIKPVNPLAVYTIFKFLILSALFACDKVFDDVWNRYSTIFYSLL